MVSLSSAENMDREFLGIVESVLNNFVRINRPTDVYVVLIDNWFDHKWLEFESHRYDNDALGWRKKLSIPRFEPHRVISQTHFHANPSNEMSYETHESKPLHILADRRFLSQICSSGVFVWYSFVDRAADRGSVMVYLNDDGRGSAWYASFAKNPNWQVNKMKGISKPELTELMACTSSAAGIQQIVGPEPPPASLSSK
jgi:hypothetical protein